MMRRLLLLFLLAPFFALGQKPIINNFSPTHIEVNQTITISGSNLSGARVFFGGVEGTVSSSTANNIQVTVPAGARNSAITVLNNGISTQSKKQFFISFSGNTISNFSSEYLLTTDEVDGYDICLCDLNGDNLNDAVISHNIITNVNNNTDREITIFRNQSTSTTTQFLKVTNINNSDNNGGFISMTCGDINNDGKPDLVFTTNNGQNSKQIFVYRNTSTPGAISVAYESSLDLRLPPSGGINRTPRRVKIADIDGDGKSDLVVGNALDNTIHIFRNTTSGAIGFDTPTEIMVSDAISTGSIDVADLNNDGLPDIAILGFQVSNKGIYILKNQSLAGQINFEIEEGILQNSSRTNIALGDFDNDGLIDLAATNGQISRVRVYKNVSSGNDIIFQSSTPTTINISGRTPWGIDLGDMNGDGLLDIGIASVRGSTTSLGSIYLLENTSTSSITFGSPIELATTRPVRNICIADINNDAKPDLAFTHDITTDRTGNLGVFTNNNCIVPSISPDDFEFCVGESFTLNATKSLGTTYSWSVTSGNGNAIPDTDSEVTAQINSGTSATIQVTITDSNGCSESATADFTLVNGAQPSAPTISGSPSSPVCVGDNFNLSAPAGQADYEWILPNGTTQSGQSLGITDADFEDAGIYTLRVRQTGGCFSLEASTNVEVTDAPDLVIINTLLDNFCVGSSVQLEVQDLSADGISYQWQLNGVDAGGTDTNATLTATESGSYTVIVTDSNNCSNTSEPQIITALPVPVSSIENNTQVCDGFPASFTSSSTPQPGFDLKYYWLIEDESSNTIHEAYTQNIVDFSFPSGTASYVVSLTTAYDSTVVNSCGNTTTMNVEVVSPPEMVFSQTSGVQKCFDQSLLIAISTPASADIISYDWTIRNADSLNDTIISSANSNTIDVSTPGNVNSVYAVASIVTTTGCIVVDSILINNFPNTADISSPDFDLSSNVVTLEEDNFIELQAENLVSDISWTPADLINDPTASNVTVFPDRPEVVVTVTGTDANNCTSTSEVTLILDNVRPNKTFSPNGDLRNDCWEVLNVSQSGDCEVFVFDSRGRNILVTTTFEQNCVWDGTFNGTPVPEGVYYYVIKCPSVGVNKSGSILLAR